MNTVIGDLVRALQSMNDQDAWYSAVSEAVLEEVARLIRDEQLAIGEDGLGRQLGEYAPLSVIIRQELGLQTKFIDLNLTGEFYDSITAKLGRDFIEVDGDAEKPDQNLFETFGEDIVGLSIENMPFIVDMVRDGYLAYVYKTLGLA